MTSSMDGGQHKLILEDLRVGQRFLSRTQTLDAGEIKASRRAGCVRVKCTAYGAKERPAITRRRQGAGSTSHGQRYQSSATSD